MASRLIGALAPLPVDFTSGVPCIAGVICVVVGIFYLVGWEMGAVEAVSLSILVGSSVDYCVHVVEGYLLAGDNPPPCAMQVSFHHCWSPGVKTKKQQLTAFFGDYSVSSFPAVCSMGRMHIPFDR